MAVSSGPLSEASSPKPRPLHLAPTHGKWTQLCEPLLSWEVLLSNDICGEFSPFCLLSTHCSLPSEIPKLYPDLTYEGVSVYVDTSSFVVFSLGCKSHLEIICLLFSLLPYLILRSLYCLFWSLKSSASIQKFVLEQQLLLFHIQMNFWCTCAEEDDFPVLFLPQLSVGSLQLFLSAITLAFTVSDIKIRFMTYRSN